MNWHIREMSNELDILIVWYLDVLLNDPTGLCSFHPPLLFAVCGQYGDHMYNLWCSLHARHLLKVSGSCKSVSDVETLDNLISPWVGSPIVLVL